MPDTCPTRRLNAQARRFVRGSATFIALMHVAAFACAGNFALHVVDYVPGAAPAAGFTNPQSALGSPAQITGDGMPFESVVSPFNPPYLPSEIVSIGAGGWLTLRLERFAVPQPLTPEIGVFTNVGIIDAGYPNGAVGTPPATFGVDAAEVEVSDDGLAWVSLGHTTFDIPTNAYADLTDPYSPTAGAVDADFGQAFSGVLADFAGAVYEPDVRALLAGSGGGTWLDISATGLDRVGYVRFRVGDAVAGSNFELDAVSVADAATGELVPEPAAFTLFACLSLAMLSTRRRRRSFDKR